MAVDLSAIESCRTELPALKTKHYFNFGGQGAMPQSSLDLIASTFQQVQQDGPFSGSIFKWISNELSETRRALAKLMGGTENNYAMTQNTTEGCNIALWGTAWKEGDELVTTDCEHDGVVSAMENIARRHGCRIHKLPVQERQAEQIVEDLKSAINARTRMLSISHVVWNTGRSLPLKEMTAVCKQSGVKVLVDGAQSAGVLPLDMIDLGCDYYAITGHKWLGGPEGVGALYISDSALPDTLETFVGWRKSMVDPDTTRLASRFEVATAPFPLLAALRNSLAFHERWGDVENRHTAITNGAGHMRRLLKETGRVTLLSDDTNESGLVSFAVADANHAKIARELEEKGYLLRTIPNPDCLRASIHYFTTHEEIEGLVRSLHESI